MLGLAANALQANQDVCAQEVSLRYTTTRGTEFEKPGVMIAAPYMGSHVQVRLAIFADNPAGNTHVEAKSSAFVGSQGSDSLPIVAGQVKVDMPVPGRYTLEGTLITSNGTRIPFSADVVLKRPY